MATSELISRSLHHWARRPAGGGPSCSLTAPPRDRTPGGRVLGQTCGRGGGWTRGDRLPYTWGGAALETAAMLLQWQSSRAACTRHF
jgi:hypothetical protein